MKIHTNLVIGLQNLCDDIEFMCNKKVSLYWRLCWYFFTPVMMIVIFIYSMATIQPIKYSDLYFPLAGDGEFAIKIDQAYFKIILTFLLFCLQLPVG